MIKRVFIHSSTEGRADCPDFYGSPPRRQLARRQLGNVQLILGRFTARL